MGDDAEPATFQCRECDEWLDESAFTPACHMCGYGGAFADDEPMCAECEDEDRRGEPNMWCEECDLFFCPYCITSHNIHDTSTDLNNKNTEMY